MENKCEGNENKIRLGDFNITVDKMDRDGGNETYRLYRCRSKCPGSTRQNYTHNGIFTDLISKRQVEIH